MNHALLSAAGESKDFASAAPLFAPLADEEPPDLEAAEVYARASAFFRTLYPAFAERFAVLATL